MADQTNPLDLQYLFTTEAEYDDSESSDSESDDDDTNFEPITYFFYGSLMDPDVLKSVTQLDKAPEYRDAWIEGYDMKIWGNIYPTLIPSSSSDDKKSGSSSTRILGMAWVATSMQHCLRLQSYETQAYKAGDCTVHFVDGQPSVEGVTFIWAGNGDYDDLNEGTFDLEQWQRDYKLGRF
ncbi:hypothetical protein B0H63DRAFT_545503 [Podospora didyma]|uniref:Putative gamma-glutamylcyclotransferase n=1 Tax=Podospora didyma TaxID=330526 RepID=A0AAE0TVN3_9PEZI|nr:hypothetical protein B0H63DRAFT_545503 [Podospora didyma]